MSEITGKVKEIFKGQVASGRNAGESFWSITLADAEETKITCFSDEEEKGWIEGLKQGVEYTFVVKVSKDEKYINIAGQTVPCVQQGVAQGADQGGDMREEVKEEKKPVKVAQRRKPPVATSSAGTERVFKNRISALQASVTFASAMAGTVDDVMENAEKFYEWISE